MNLNYKFVFKFRTKKFLLLFLFGFTISTTVYSALKTIQEINLSIYNVKLYDSNNRSNANIFKNNNSETKLFKIPKFRWCPTQRPANPNIDCKSLIRGDKSAIVSAKHWKSPCPFSDTDIAQLTENCTKLEKLFPHWSDVRERFLKINKSHANYPLAFVIVGAKNAEQLIRLFQSVYTSDNLYCLSYDNKAANDFKRVMHNLDLCYDNVIMPNEFVDIYWSGFSILQTIMNCLEVLYNQKEHKWKYVQILSWNDYPLRTNEEMIKIMQIFNGSQDSLLHRADINRSRYYYNVKRASTKRKKHLIPEKKHHLKPIPPGGLVEYMGSLATTMSREFVKFMFENSVARQLYQWSNTTYMAEEMYFSTLIHNSHINAPGAFPGSCQKVYEEIYDLQKRYISRHQVFYDQGDCAGKWTFYSCVFGAGDLKKLSTLPELMAHKVYLDYQPAVYYCLSQMHYNRTMHPRRYQGLDLKFYENLPAVRYENMADKSQFNC